MHHWRLRSGEERCHEGTEVLEDGVKVGWRVGRTGVKWGWMLGEELREAGGI